MSYMPPPQGQWLGRSPSQALAETKDDVELGCVFWLNVFVHDVWRSFRGAVMHEGYRLVCHELISIRGMVDGVLDQCLQQKEVAKQRTRCSKQNVR